MIKQAAKRICTCVFLFMGVLIPFLANLSCKGTKAFNHRSEIETGTEIKQDRISTADLFGLAGLWLLPYDHRPSERSRSDATDVREAESNSARRIGIRARLKRV